MKPTSKGVGLFELDRACLLGGSCILATRGLRLNLHPQQKEAGSTASFQTPRGITLGIRFSRTDSVGRYAKHCRVHLPLPKEEEGSLYRVNLIPESLQ
jgi:hypothetical protein